MYFMAQAAIVARPPREALALVGDADGVVDSARDVHDVVRDVGHHDGHALRLMHDLDAAVLHVEGVIRAVAQLPILRVACRVQLALAQEHRELGAAGHFAAVRDGDTLLWLGHLFHWLLFASLGCMHRFASTPVIGISLKLFHLNAENETQKL